METLEENLSKSEQDKLDLDYQVQLLDKVKEELGMNQSDIARKFGMGTATISHWAKQNGKMPLVARIALELMLKEKEHQRMTSLFQNFSMIMREIEKN